MKHLAAITLAVSALVAVPAPADASSIPGYPGRARCTEENAAIIRWHFAQHGASPSTQRWALIIASRESGCDHTAYNGRGNDRSSCAFQLNALRGPLAPGGYLTRLGYTPELVRSSMEACAAAAADLWARCGRGPWTRPYGCRRPSA
jgi:hypothetical protein